MEEKNLFRIKKFLKKFDLSNEESHFLLKILKNKERKLDLGKSQNNSALKVAKSLLKKGFLEKRGTEYVMLPLQVVLKKIQQESFSKIESLKTESQFFQDYVKNFLGGLAATRINFFEGIDGIRDSYEQFTAVLNKEVCSYFSMVDSFDLEIQNLWEKEFMMKKKKRGIFSKYVVSKTPKTVFLKLQEKKLSAEFRMMPYNFFPPNNCEISFCEEYLLFVSFDKKSPYALIARDKNLTSINQSIFDFLWIHLKYQTLLNQNKKFSKEITTKTNIENTQYWKHIYMTSEPDSLIETIRSRKDMFPPDLPEKWHKIKPRFMKKEDGEEILTFEKHEVASSFHKPYMKELSKIATTHGGEILNIGYGMAMIDTFIEEKRNKREIKNHHIIELNDFIFKRAQNWKKTLPASHQIKLWHGNWQEVLPQMSKKKTLFDGVIYDAYPLSLDEIHRDAIDFIYSLVHFKLLKEKTGILTFYVDSKNGLGESFQKFLYDLGFTEIQTKKVKISLPNRKSQIWDEEFYLAPLITGLDYSKTKIV